MTGWQYVVGRTMFETDKLPKEFVPRQVHAWSVQYTIWSVQSL